MKIGYFSDLHTEFMRPKARIHKYDRERPICIEDFSAEIASAWRDMDVIIAAGDIGTGVRAINFLAGAFPDKPVIYTPGNHDYWGGEIYSTVRKMKEAAQGTSVHVMPNGESIDIDGVRFIAATLWTDYQLTDSQYNMDRAQSMMNDFHQIITGPKPISFSARELMVNAGSIMNDYRKIRLRRNSEKVYIRDEYPRRLTAMDLLATHRKHLEAIKRAMRLAHEDRKPLVVVTHHAPSARSLVANSAMDMERYVYQRTDPFYASHLDHLMKGEDAPLAWVHGHTHVPVSYRNGRTCVYSNPKGYGHGTDTDWEAGRFFVIEELIEEWQ